MKGKKRQSKRLTLRKKYKILRKVREHKRKVRKTDKQGKKKEKDPGIPNNYPFKAQALAALEQMKLNEEQEKELERLQRIKYAQTKRQQALEKRRKEQEELRLKKERFSVRGSKQKIYGRCREVAEEAEIIVEVVDARDPLGCISPEVEKWIRFNYPDRLFVRLLNKIDLVPKECVTRWLSYLRNEHPALAFKCPIKVKEKKKKNKHGYVFAPKDEPVTHRMTPKTCLGLDNLVQLCKTYAASFSDNRTVTVGVVGWPGVGKASVLQQLRSLKVASLAFEEGHEFHVAPNVRVLDYPGLVIPSSEVSPVDLTLRGCLAPENVPNPYGATEKIVNRVSKEQLLETYKISMFENVREFLELVAKKGGRQTTGGKPDVTAAAKQVIRDWTSGKIKFFTEPPALTTAPAAADWRSKVGMDALQRAEEEHVLPLLKAAADASFTSYGTAHVFNRAVEPKFLSFLEGRAMDEEVAEDGMDEVAEDEEDGEDEDEEEEDGEEDEGEEEEEEEQKVSKKVSKTTRKAKEVAKGMMALEGDFDFATDFVATSDVAGNIIAVDGEEEEDDDYEDDEEEDGGDDDEEEEEASD